MNLYEFTDDMQELSGFGGGYEAGCRKMVVAGLRWWDAHPDADPKFVGWKGIFGVLAENNADAEALTKVITDAEDGCTGAMHQAAIGHILWIRRHSWLAYVAESKARKAAEPKEEE